MPSLAHSRKTPKPRSLRKLVSPRLRRATRSKSDHGCGDAAQRIMTPVRLARSAKKASDRVRRERDRLHLASTTRHTRLPEPRRTIVDREEVQRPARKALSRDRLLRSCRRQKAREAVSYTHLRAHETGR